MHGMCVPTKEAVSMRNLKLMAISAVSIALVLASAPAAFAAPHGRQRVHPAPYRISRPSVVTDHVTMGVSFEATGVVVPAIAADDASTTVAIKVYGLPGRGLPKLVSTVPAALSAGVTTGTAYDASVTLPGAGPYELVAVVSVDGSVVARSTARPLLSTLPYRISKPHLASGRVVAGVSFDATGVVVPAIAGDDASTTVSVLVMRVGRRQHLTRIATVGAALTGSVGTGTGYDASVTLSTAGRYVFVAVVMRDGVVLGRSGQRPVRAVAASSANPSGSRMTGK
jgi:hypothetical protein